MLDVTSLSAGSPRPARVHRPRVMPVLLLKGDLLYKSVQFKDHKYVGDPRIAVKIFNDKGCDELVLLDITATNEGRRPNFQLIEEIASEAFMPVAYGGGIRDVADAKRILALGVEKIVINTIAVENPQFVSQAAEQFGSSSVVVCMDVKRSLLGKYEVHTQGGRSNARLDPAQHAKHMAKLGAGEIIVNSIDRDGMMQGYDLDLVKRVSSAVDVPVIACGGAGNVDHLAEAIQQGGASAVAAGSLFVFQGRHRAVLINFPDHPTLHKAFEK